MRTYHLHMPFSRQKLLKSHLDFLGNQPVHLHLICEAKDVPELQLPSWVSVVVCDPFPGGDWFIGSWKTNWFLDHHSFTDDDRYCIYNDDDFYEEGFFEKLEQQPGDLVICSMKRGDHQPPGSPHPGGVLLASPENLRVGYVGGEQIIAKGKIQRHYRLAHGYEGDWGMLSAMLQDIVPHFAPEANVRFNYFEPGRWDGVTLP